MHSITIQLIKINLWLSMILQNCLDNIVFEKKIPFWIRWVCQGVLSMIWTWNHWQEKRFCINWKWKSWEIHCIQKVFPLFPSDHLLRCIYTLKSLLCNKITDHFSCPELMVSSNAIFKRTDCIIQLPSCNKKLHLNPTSEEHLNFLDFVSIELLMVILDLVTILFHFWFSLTTFLWQARGKAF